MKLFQKWKQTSEKPFKRMLYMQHLVIPKKGFKSISIKYNLEIFPLSSFSYVSTQHKLSFLRRILKVFNTLQNLWIDGLFHVESAVTKEYFKGHIGSICFKKIFVFRTQYCKTFLDSYLYQNKIQYQNIIPLRRILNYS